MFKSNCQSHQTRRTYDSETILCSFWNLHKYWINAQRMPGLRSNNRAHTLLHLVFDGEAVKSSISDQLIFCLLMLMSIYCYLLDSEYLWITIRWAQQFCFRKSINNDHPLLNLKDLFVNAKSVLLKSTDLFLYYSWPFLKQWMMRKRYHLFIDKMLLTIIFPVNQARFSTLRLAKTPQLLIHSLHLC